MLKEKSSVFVCTCACVLADLLFDDRHPKHEQQTVVFTILSTSSQAYNSCIIIIIIVIV